MTHPASSAYFALRAHLATHRPTLIGSHDVAVRSAYARAKPG
ncbi:MULTISPECIES: hypothetical protein [Bordetella]|uniref:Uncharacterized protein n=1 Tax=Bordetella petrii TaxID=94624 RepID=A0ABT7W834_9BORD|nr:MULTISPECIES: hypothetical protein [Bordetella]MDM9561348.1 hypothetical protein [Bordetella petrii]